MVRTILLLLLTVTSQIVCAQSVTGSWYGRADVMARGVSNNYLTELILKQKGNEVEGIFGYYFKDSYQSFFVRGTYNINTREVSIKNLPVLFHKSTSTRDGIECPMSFFGTLMVSQVSSNLRGSFYTDDRYKYTCPELRVNFAMDKAESNQDSILSNAITGKKMWKPQEEDFVITKATNNKATTITADVTAANTDKAVPDEIVPEAEKELIARFDKRKTVYNMDLEVESDSVRVSFYDNGDVDGDSISVFLNRKPLLVRQELSARALNIYLTLDSNKAVNELSMFAENLGKYPPNTALMLVTDGINRYEVYLSSSFTQNASIRLKRKRSK
jgi:hypothetical protein